MKSQLLLAVMFMACVAVLTGCEEEPAPTQPVKQAAAVKPPAARTPAPAPEQAPAAAPAKLPAEKKRRSPWLFAGIGCFVMILACGGLLFFMDAFYPDLLYAPLRWLGFF